MGNSLVCRISDNPNLTRVHFTGKPECSKSSTDHSMSVTATLVPSCQSAHDQGNEPLSTGSAIYVAASSL